MITPRLQCPILTAVAMTAASLMADIPADQPGLVKREFIYKTAPFPECHASTVAETKDGLVCAWFGGKEEKDPSVGIWMARSNGGAWSAPVEVATGVQPDGSRLPCWNPVLHVFKEGPPELVLYYKVGPRPSAWWGMMKRSADSGRSWSEARRLPDGFLGPIKNKPVALADGRLLSPSSTESDDGKEVWRIHFELGDRDFSKPVRVQPAAPSAGRDIDAIQPTILTHPNGHLQALARTGSGKIGETWSKDRAATWSALALTSLPNPDSGIDAVTLRDGRHLLVYNHTPTDRSPLNVAVSADGRTWQAAVVLENDPGEYSYPAVIQTSDGLVHLTYTWKRELLRHVVLDPGKLVLRPIVGGAWPR